MALASILRGRVRRRAAAELGDEDNQASEAAHSRNCLSGSARLALGAELVPVEAVGFRAPELRSTVANPDYVAVDASRDRLELAQQAGCLELALNAADTTGARNSLEAMLTHHLAAAHKLAMKLAVPERRLRHSLGG